MQHYKQMQYYKILLRTGWLKHVGLRDIWMFAAKGVNCGSLIKSCTSTRTYERLYCMCVYMCLVLAETLPAQWLTFICNNQPCDIIYLFGAKGVVVHRLNHVYMTILYVHPRQQFSLKGCCLGILFVFLCLSQVSEYFIGYNMHRPKHMKKDVHTISLSNRVSAHA